MTRINRLRAAERAILTEALIATKGNQREAAALCGDPLRTFQRRLAALLSPQVRAELADEHGWPAQTEAAAAARRKAPAAN